MLGWYSGKQTTQKGYLGNGVGTYNLNGGLLTGGNPSATYSGYEVVGVSGTGIFNQTGGTNLVSNKLDVGGTQNWGSLFAMPFNPGYGVYNLSGGLLNAEPYGIQYAESVGAVARASSSRRAEPT